MKLDKAGTGDKDRAGGSKAARLDAVDRRILMALQENCDIPLAELARKAGLSSTPCWNRVQRLEAEGVITARVALVNPQKVGLGLTAFVSVEAAEHSGEWLKAFSQAVTRLPEVVEIYRMAGDVDYVLKVVTQDMAAYDEFYKLLIGAVPLKNVSSRFAMERIKATTALKILPD
jgi:Lrp/AsnC family transcriptional regulator